MLLVLILAISPWRSSIAQTCDMNWVPLSELAPPYIANEWCSAFAEFRDACGRCDLIASEAYAGPDDGYIQGPVAWDGHHWRQLGGGVSGEVFAFQVFDDGSGPSLFVGGRFQFAGGIEVNNIAKWDGRQWSSLAGGIPGSEYPTGVISFQIFDDGRGPALYAGGSFDSVGGIEAHNIARWDGRQWESLDEGLSNDQGIPSVRDMEVFDDGSGAALFVGGNFTDASGTGARWIAKWNGLNWSSIGFNPKGTVQTMRTYDDGTGARLYLCLSHAPGIVKWNGRSIEAVTGSMSGSVWYSGAEVFDDGSGNGSELFVSGNFTVEIDGHPTNLALAKWNGRRWASIGADALFGNVGVSTIYAGDTHLVAARTTYGVNRNIPYLLAWNAAGWSSLPVSPQSTDRPDVNGDGFVNVADLLAVITSWGPCGKNLCCTDVDADGTVGPLDLLLIIQGWS